MKDRPASTPQHFGEDLERLRALEYIPKPHLDFFESISRAHFKAKDRISDDKIYPSVAEKSAHDMLSTGFPIMNFGRMKVKVRPLRAHLNEICSILTQYEQSEPGQIERFSKSEDYKKLDLKTFISKTVSQDADYLRSLSKKTGVDENTLKFMAITLARPLFELAAAEVKDRVNGYSWWKNYCPACGSEPFMAWIRKGDNMRFLGCSLCGSEWTFDRVTCPFCNNKDQKSLKNYYYHEESAHRLYGCDKCKRYIKCVDQRKMELTKTLNLSVEDVATLYLDTLALEKGYVPGWVFKDRESQESSPKP
jgi:FdhE protein